MSEEVECNDNDNIDETKDDFGIEEEDPVEKAKMISRLKNIWTNQRSRWKRNTRIEKEKGSLLKDDGGHE